MNDERPYKLILKSKIFRIPSDFRFMSMINEDIYAKLKIEGQYEIKSNAREKVFNRFIEYWINKKIPYISQDNIREYEDLSNEFGIMTEIIRLFKKMHEKSPPNTNISSLLRYNYKFNHVIQKKIDSLNYQSKKYHNIIDILFKNGSINNKESFLKTKNLILQCPRVSIKKISLFTKKSVKNGFLTFYLNEEEKTATVSCDKNAGKSITIPKTVDYQGSKYEVTSIAENSFRSNNEINSIQFPSDSKIQLIDKNAFFDSSLGTIEIPATVKRIGNRAFYNCYNLRVIKMPVESKLESIGKEAFNATKLINISIPSNVTELDEGWCFGAKNLTNVEILPNNKIYCHYDGKFILGKINKLDKNYEVLVFARRDIETATIPSFIKYIAPFAFDSCGKLKSIEFEKGSQLKVIGRNAFAKTDIKIIVIPSHVTQICNSAFHECQCLEKIEFAEQSELQVIDKFSFCTSLSLKSISIPSTVIDLNKGWCCGTDKLTQFDVDANNKFFINYNNDFILGKSNSSNENFDILVFARRDIKRALIPSNIKIIAPYAFMNCKLLKIIEFEKNSQLKFIQKKAFHCSSITKIVIPPNVIEISDFAFDNCYNLEKVDFADNSKLKTIGKRAFFNCHLENGIIFPPSLLKIDKLAFALPLCGRPQIIEIPEDSDLKTFDQNAFQNSIDVLVMFSRKSNAKGLIYNLCPFHKG